MKFHLASFDGHLFTGSGPGWIRIGAQEYREGLLLTPETVVTGWAAAGFAGLVESDFAQLAAWQPELVVFGTGPSIRFPAPRLTRALVDAGIGLEVMDTKAACRTYNILAAEGRKVAAAILLTDA